MPIFCRNAYFLQKDLISVTKQGHVRLIHPFKEVNYGKKSVIVHCKNKIILQIIFISAETTYFC